MSTIKTNQLAHTANGAATYTLPQTDGSSGQVLQTNGSGALSWVTLPTDTNDNTWVKLSTIDASNSANVSFTDSITGAFDTYTTYAVAVADLRPVTDDVTLRMRLFDSSGEFSSGEYSTHVHAFTDGDHGYNGASQFQLTRHGIGNNTSGSIIYEDLMGLWYFNGFPSNKRLKIIGHSVNKSNSSSTMVANIGGTVNNHNAVTALKFFMSSGNIALGKFTLYGIKQ